jgi:hypothetical protein
MQSGWLGTCYVGWDDRQTASMPDLCNVGDGTQDIIQASQASTKGGNIPIAGTIHAQHLISRVQRAVLQYKKLVSSHAS